MNPKQSYYETCAATICQALKKRRMEGYYCKTAAEAKELALSFVQEGDTVSFGGSMTLNESGLLDALRSQNAIRLLDRSQASSPAQIEDIYAAAFRADVYFMSTNAITLDGELVNIDGNGNRVAALIWGPRQVVILAGMNKVCPTLADACRRAREIAAPPNCVRLNKKTPCAAAGLCKDCYGDDCICSQTVITRRSGTVGRIKVILIGETLGY